MPLSTIEKDIKSIREEFARRLFFESEEPFFDENRRMNELATTYYISTGNVEKVKELITASIGNNEPDLHSSSYGDLSERPTEQALGLLISAITLFTRAALDAGLPENISYALSDVYINHAFSMKDPKKIMHLSSYAMYDFTVEVNKYQYRDLSIATKVCCEYIKKHLHEKISLNDLAKVSKLSPNYVSDIFAKELNIRPLEFIRNQKLEYACNILKTADISVNALAYLLAFPSTSSFISYFKDKYGVTPLQFKKKGLTRFM